MNTTSLPLHPLLSSKFFHSLIEKNHYSTEDWQQLLSTSPRETQLLLLQIQALQQKAQEKLGLAPFHFTDRLGLEQSSHWTHSVYKEKLLPPGSASDLCCGIGGDSQKMTQRTVFGMDLSPLRLQFFTLNSRLNNPNRLALQADALRPPVQTDWFLIDPDRRDPKNKSKNWNPQNLRPSLEEIISLSKNYRGGLIKLSPAAHTDHLNFPHKRIYLGDKYSCKETLLLTGELIDTIPQNGATLLSETETHFYPSSKILNLPCIKTSADYLYEPCKVLLRSKGYLNLGNELNLSLGTPDGAYLFGNTKIESPWLQGFKILASCNNRPKKIRRMIQSFHKKIVAVKKRGMEIDPDQTLKDYAKIPGDSAAELAFCLINRKPTVFLLERL